MESNSIPRNWNGSGIENLKISGIGMELELKWMERIFELNDTLFTIWFAPSHLYSILEPSGKLDISFVSINALNGIPDGPQSQSIHFNNEINPIVTKDNFTVNDKKVLFKIEITNK